MNDKKVITTFLIKKDEDDNDKIDAKEYFENVEQYLNINPKISIGKLHNHYFRNKEKKEKKFHLLINKDFTKDMYLSSNKNNIKSDNSELKLPKQELCISSYKSKEKNPIKIKGRNKNPITERNNNSQNVHYKYKSFEDLKIIFSSSKEREEKFKLQGTNNLIPLTTDNDIKKKFLDQGKQLQYNLVYKCNSERYFQNLANKCKKKESELLINNIQSYRMKKQIKEYIENNKLLSEKLGNNYWLFNLRRSPKNDFTKMNYFNIGTKEREIWKRYMDYPDKEIELINLPYSNNKRHFRFNTENSKDKNSFDIVQKLNKFDDIKIEGKNLAQKEFNDIENLCCKSDTHIKFRMYKDPKECDNNYVKDLIYKEIYQLKNDRKNKKKKMKLKLIKQ